MNVSSIDGHSPDMESRKCQKRSKHNEHHRFN